MSIASLKKVTIVGHASEKERALSDLQDFGCMHIIPLATGDRARAATGPSSEAREALRFLLTCPLQRKHVVSREGFDPREVEAQALRLRRQLGDLRDECDFLTYRIRELRRWGDFELPPLDELDGYRLWFYVVPHRHMAAVESSGLRYEVVNRDARFSYVVVVAKNEPDRDALPVQRIHTGNRPLHELEKRLEQVEMAIEDAEAERSALTRWCGLLAANLDRLEDDAARRDAARQTMDSQPLFALQGWVPAKRLDELREHTAERGLALEVVDPEVSEEPPTLLDNPPATNAGEALVTFYMTPGYWSWDPSSIVLVSFALFFGMILADAGYAVLLALVLVRYWKRMGQSEGGRRFRRLFTSLTAATFVYGVLTGSYFGIPLRAGSALATLQVLDLKDSSTMMGISVVVGVLHVMLANLMSAHRMGPRPAALAPLGWAAIVGGGFVLAIGVLLPSNAARIAGIVVASIGIALVFLFAGFGEKPIRRIGYGFLALTNLTKAFGDVLSYLRLFALGLATASLAVAFNDMAADIRQAFPGVGLLLALLVLLLGHSLNFILGVASGVIHGLRLNVIEFFNWGMTDEGRLFRPFQRKGV